MKISILYLYLSYLSTFLLKEGFSYGTFFSLSKWFFGDFLDMKMGIKYLETIS